MNRTNLGRGAGILVGLLALTGIKSAEATPVQVWQLQTGVDAGPQETAGGPGAEQAFTDWVQVGQDVYVVSIYMSSKVSDDDAPWQCKCSSLKLSPTGQPTLVADQIQITTNRGGDRICNHPKGASDGTRIFWSYGSDDNNTNPQTFVSAVDHMCQTVMPNRLKISNDDNANEGAPDLLNLGGGLLSAGYLSTNNNDRSVAVGLQVTELGGGLVDAAITYRTTVVAPSNIGRPTIEKMDNGYSVFCAAKGDQRPPEVGVECAVLDQAGDIMFSQLIAASDPDNNIYMNQPTLAKLDNGQFALRVLQSEGGRNNGGEAGKGSNVSREYILAPLTNSFSVMGPIADLGSYATHSSICSGKYGTEGKTFFATYGSAISGNGQPIVEFFGYDNGLQQDTEHNKWVAGWYADSGKLAKLYGENPNNQGRDFLRCKGDIPNPGFGGGADALLPNVKTFFAVPHAGRVPGEPKNSQWLGLVPGWTTVQAEPGGAVEGGAVELGPQGEDTDPTPPPAGGNGAGAGSPVGAGGSTSDSTSSSGGSELQPNGSGCAVGGTSSTRIGWVLVGLGLALGARRRKGV